MRTAPPAPVPARNGNSRRVASLETERNSLTTELERHKRKHAAAIKNSEAEQERLQRQITEAKQKETAAHVKAARSNATAAERTAALAAETLAHKQTKKLQAEYEEVLKEAQAKFNKNESEIQTLKEKLTEKSQAIYALTQAHRKALENLEAARASKNANAETIAQHTATIARQQLNIAKASGNAKATRNALAAAQATSNTNKAEAARQLNVAKKQVEEFRKIARNAETNAQREAANKQQKIAEANAKLATARIKQAVAHLRASKAIATGKNVAEARNAAQAQARNLQTALNAATKTHKEYLTAATTAHTKALNNAQKQANAAKKTAAARLFALRVTEVKARKNLANKNAAIAAARGNANAQRRASENAVAAREALQQAHSAVIAERNSLQKESNRQQTMLANALTNARETKGHLKNAQDALSAVTSEAAEYSARKNVEHAALQAQINQVQASLASALAKEAAAVAAAGNKNMNIRFLTAAHNNVERQRNELQRTLNAAKANAAKAAANAHTNAARKNAQAQAQLLEHQQVLATAQRKLENAQAGTQEAQNAKAAVEAALNSERKAKEQLEAAHKAYLRQINAEAASHHTQWQAVYNKSQQNLAAALKEAKNAKNNAERTRAAANLAASIKGTKNALANMIRNSIRRGINNKKSNTGMGVTQQQQANPVITVSPIIKVKGGGGGNMSAALNKLKGNLSANLMNKIKNALKPGSPPVNTTANNKTELLKHLYSLIKQRNELSKKANKTQNNKNAIDEIDKEIATTKELMRLLGMNIKNNKPPSGPPPVPRNNNINKALNERDRFVRLQKLFNLYKQTTDKTKKDRIIQEIRIIIRKLYGPGTSTTQAIRNISNANTLMRKKVNKTVNENLNRAIKFLKQTKPSTTSGRSYIPTNKGYIPGGGGGGYIPGSGGGGYIPGGGGGGYIPGGGGGGYIPGGGGGQPVSIKINTGGSRSTVGNAGSRSAVGNAGSRSAVGNAGVSGNGGLTIGKTSEQLIREGGGSEAIEKGINALRQSGGNASKASAVSKLPMSTFTNIYAMGGPVAAKKAVERRRRRHVTKKKPVKSKPRKQYIKLTPYQFKRLTDHIKKNNLRKVLIKEITH
jgi:hypothetical protein